MRPWTTNEVKHLLDNHHLGAVVIAAQLGRSVQSVRNKARKLNVSLRKAGERRGLLLGQPRGVRWQDSGHVTQVGRMSRLRQDVLDGKTDLAGLYAQVRLAVEEPVRPVCPLCTVRPVQREHTGLCHVCHLRELARAHRDVDDLDDAQRELWRARQERSRSRRKEKP